jgi:hypothetical protein
VDTAAKTVKRATTESDSGSFSHVDELEKSLRDQDDVRADVVKKAAALVNQDHYPPAETMNRFANLLAIKMGMSD